MCVCVCVCVCLSVSRSLTHTHAHTHARARTNVFLLQSQLQKYIKFARTLNPQITPEAGKVMVKEYRRLRQGDSSGAHEPLRGRVERVWWRDVVEGV